MRPGEVGNASVAARQVRQDPPTRGIGQRRKSPVQRSRNIFNHLVNYQQNDCDVQTFFWSLLQPDLGVCFAGLPILKRIENCESISSRRPMTSRASEFDFNVETFVSNALSSGPWHKRRYKNVYDRD
jgi:hypothetical protein